MSFKTNALAAAAFLLLCGGAFAGFRYGPGLILATARPPVADPPGAAAPEARVERQEAEEILDKRFNGGGLGVVIASALNVRAEPGLRGHRLQLLRCGDVVQLGIPQGGWYPVDAEGVHGFSHGAYLFPLAPGGSLPPCDEGRGPSAPRQEPGIGALVQEAPDPAPRPAPEPAIPLTPPSERSAAPSPPDPPAQVRQAAAPRAPGRGPVQIALATSGKAKAVGFPHQDHNAMFGCAQCHHPLGDPRGEANAEKACHSCHGSAAGSGTSPFTAREVMHKTCQGCHQAQSAGPQKCSECHTGK